MARSQVALPPDLGAPAVKTDGHEIHPVNVEAVSHALHRPPFAIVEGFPGVVSAAACFDLHDEASRTVAADQVDLVASPHDVARHDANTMPLQISGSDGLAEAGYSLS